MLQLIVLTILALVMNGSYDVSSALPTKGSPRKTIATVPVVGTVTKSPTERTFIPPDLTNHKNMLDEIIVITNAEKSFSDATEHCVSENMKLIRIRNSIVKNYLKAKKLKDFYMDGKYDKDQKIFLFTDNSRQEYDNWDEAKPLSQDCIVVSGLTGKWMQRHCAQPHVVVCYKTLIYISKEMSFEDAFKDCQKYGLNLAEAVDKRLSIKLLQIAGSIKMKEFWIDGTDVDSEGIFHIKDNSKSILLGNYGPKEPSGGVKENCLTLYRETHYEWYDSVCEDLRPSMCTLDKSLHYDDL